MTGEPLGVSEVRNTATGEVVGHAVIEERDSEKVHRIVWQEGGPIPSDTPPPSGWEQWRGEGPGDVARPSDGGQE